VRQVTLCFLRRAAGDSGEVCLGWKKTGFGVNKWVGIGGKVDDAARETVAQAARRELREEVRVEAGELTKVAELTFLFPHQPAWNMHTHVYLVRAWQGQPTETEEMRPRWFAVDEIPYAAMWDDAQYWLPRVIAGERLRARFSYDQANRVDHMAIEVLQPADRYASQADDGPAA
jgi:8-oxo-dGTP diphosphatase